MKTSWREFSGGQGALASACWCPADSAGTAGGPRSTGGRGVAEACNGHTPAGGVGCLRSPLLMIVIMVVVMVVVVVLIMVMVMDVIMVMIMITMMIMILMMIMVITAMIMVVVMVLVVVLIMEY